MTTADRIDPGAYRAWSPAVVITDEDEYVGKHRRPGLRMLSLSRMFYTPRHLARGR